MYIRQIISSFSSLVIIYMALVVEVQAAIAEDGGQIQVSAPIDTDSAGRAGDIAVQSVVRLECPAQNSTGTGFFHKSGNIITADHVVRGCSAPDVILSDGRRVSVSIIAMDQDRDLALVKPGINVKVTPLAISRTNEFKIGTQVSTWGFPAGYNGQIPMLSVGYLAGINEFRSQSGIVSRWVVNAAFNSGNSGGPLVHIETGTVFGVVSSKLAPISPLAADILSLLDRQKSGFQYTAKNDKGENINVSEGQLIGMVLNELRRQVQLVIGMAVTTGDLKAFLEYNNIDP